GQESPRLHDPEGRRKRPALVKGKGREGSVRWGALAAPLRLYCPAMGVAAPGTVIAGRYRVDRLLGQGGMGSVWAATHMVTHKPVAPKLRGDPARLSPRRRFEREARAASAVAHPNIVAIHDVFETDEGIPVMVMDLLIGEPLDYRLV